MYILTTEDHARKRPSEPLLYLHHGFLYDKQCIELAYLYDAYLDETGYITDFWHALQHDLEVLQEILDDRHFIDMELYDILVLLSQECSDDKNKAFWQWAVDNYCRLLP